MKIALSVVVALLMLGCSSEDRKEIKNDVKEMKQEVKEKASKTKETIKEKTSTLVSTVKDSTAYVVEAVIPEKIDAKLLYSACAGCHGASAEKQALGKSAVIKGWSEQKIIDALNGYEDGSYGGPLKGMMKTQAGKLDKKEKEAIAAYISKL